MYGAGSSTYVSLPNMSAQTCRKNLFNSCLAIQKQLKPRGTRNRSKYMNLRKSVYMTFNWQHGQHWPEFALFYTGVSVWMYDGVEKYFRSWLLLGGLHSFRDCRNGFGCLSFSTLLTVYSCRFLAHFHIHSSNSFSRELLNVLSLKFSNIFPKLQFNYGEGGQHLSNSVSS